MTRKTSPVKLDKYRSRSRRIDYLNRSDNIYAKAWFGNLAVLAFVFIDFFCLKVVWNLVQTEEPLYVWCIAFACAAALDVPLAIAAIEERKYRQGLSNKKERNMILILSAVVFCVAFAFSFGFRIFTKELSFEIGSGATLTNTLADAAEKDADTGNPAVMFAALFNGVIPLLTSVSSFVISYFGANPLGMKLKRLEKERVGLQSNILQAEKALVEAETSEQHCKGLLAREKDLYAEFINQLDADALAVKQLVRVLIMRKLGSPEDITAMSKSGDKLVQSYGIENMPKQELPDFVGSQFGSSGEENIEYANSAV